MMKKKYWLLVTVPVLLVLVLWVSAPSYGLDYSFEGAEQALFGRPTSDNTTYVDPVNVASVKRNKDAAYIPPDFGSPMADLPGTGELLTPNLVSGAEITNGSVGSGVTYPNNSYQPGNSVSQTVQPSDIYYAAGHIGRLKIPAIGLDVKVYEGTGDIALKNGVGHFRETSTWSGNVAIAGHNRGVNSYFGEIHTLEKGDKITYTTKLGSRTYKVYSIKKIKSSNLAVLDNTITNQLTLITCVKNQPDYRWCVLAREVK